MVFFCPFFLLLSSRRKQGTAFLGPFLVFYWSLQKFCVLNWAFESAGSEKESKHKSCLELSTSSCVRKPDSVFLMCRNASFEHFQVFCKITFNNRTFLEHVVFLVLNTLLGHFLQQFSLVILCFQYWIATPSGWNDATCKPAWVIY